MKGERTYQRDGFVLKRGAPDYDDSRTYLVIVEGVQVGRVGVYRATMERRSKGKRYVNARWSAERWWAQEQGKSSPFLGRFESASEAARWIIRNSEPWR